MSTEHDVNEDQQSEDQEKEQEVVQTCPFKGASPCRRDCALMMPIPHPTEEGMMLGKCVFWLIGLRLSWMGAPQEDSGIYKP